MIKDVLDHIVWRITTWKSNSCRCWCKCLIRRHHLNVEVGNTMVRWHYSVGGNRRKNVALQGCSKDWLKVQKCHLEAFPWFAFLFLPSLRLLLFRIVIFEVVQNPSSFDWVWAEVCPSSFMSLANTSRFLPIKFRSRCFSISDRSAFFSDTSSSLLDCLWWVATAHTCSVDGFQVIAWCFRRLEKAFLLLALEAGWSGYLYS